MVFSADEPSTFPTGTLPSRQEIDFTIYTHRNLSEIHATIEFPIKVGHLLKGVTVLHSILAMLHIIHVPIFKYAFKMIFDLEVKYSVKCLATFLFAA